MTKRPYTASKGVHNTFSTYHFRQSFTPALICTFHNLCPISFTCHISYLTSFTYHISYLTSSTFNISYLTSSTFNISYLTSSTFNISYLTSSTFNISYLTSSTCHILIIHHINILCLFSLQKVPSYMSNYKNPCWYDPPSPNGTLSCLPYFYLLGVTKCGTGSFFRNIRQHPDIYYGRVKEMHYWDYINKSKLFLIQATNVSYYIYLCNGQGISVKHTHNTDDV